jgi:hypothetical protein
VIGFAGGVGVPGVSEPMLRFDGEVADCPLGAACAFVLLVGLLLWVPL